MNFSNFKRLHTQCGLQPVCLSTWTGCLCFLLHLSHLAWKVAGESSRRFRALQKEGSVALS